MGFESLPCPDFKVRLCTGYVVLRMLTQSSCILSVHRVGRVQGTHPVQLWCRASRTCSLILAGYRVSIKNGICWLCHQQVRMSLQKWHLLVFVPRKSHDSFCLSSSHFKISKYVSLSSGLRAFQSVTFVLDCKVNAFAWVLQKQDLHFLYFCDSSWLNLHWFSEPDILGTTLSIASPRDQCAWCGEQFCHCLRKYSTYKLEGIFQDASHL